MKQGDRTAHDARRGKKVPTLAALSRELPNEQELKDFGYTLKNEPSDRTAAIMAAGLVENALLVSICSRIVDPGEEIRKQWFEGANAPFGTFAAKIQLGRALGIYGPEMHRRLSGVKDIRNVFAHRCGPIDFTHPSLVKAVSGFTKVPLPPEGKTPARERYSTICLTLATGLINDSLANAEKEIEIRFG